MIGGITCSENVGPCLIDGEFQTLTQLQMDTLWRLFQEIGRAWNDVYQDSTNLKSSWLELVKAKADNEPSYIGEYVNAVYVINELMEMYGDQAFGLLFFKNGIEEEVPVSRLAHMKKYVLDEFIRMQVLAGGFKHFGSEEVRKARHKNYKGYLGGSRYYRRSVVRAYVPEDEN